MGSIKLPSGPIVRCPVQCHEIHSSFCASSCMQNIAQNGSMIARFSLPTALLLCAYTPGCCGHFVPLGPHRICPFVAVWHLAFCSHNAHSFNAHDKISLFLRLANISLLMSHLDLPFNPWWTVEWLVPCRLLWMQLLRMCQQLFPWLFAFTSWGVYQEVLLTHMLNLFFNLLRNFYVVFSNSCTVFFQSHGQCPRFLFLHMLASQNLLLWFLLVTVIQ